MKCFRASPRPLLAPCFGLRRLSVLFFVHSARLSPLQLPTQHNQLYCMRVSCPPLSTLHSSKMLLIRKVLLAITILPAVLPVAADDLALEQSITAYNDYQMQRTCVQNCFNYWGDTLGRVLQCPVTSSSALNDCWCRADLRSSAVSWLSSCAAAGCSKDSVDINAVTSLYTGYCGAKIAPSPSDGGPAPMTTTNGEHIQRCDPFLDARVINA